MCIRALIILASLFVAAPLFANETKIYSSYETVRQSLLENPVADVQKSSKTLASAAIGKAGADRRSAEALAKRPTSPPHEESSRRFRTR